jgi:predicted short-subunit dehydrogenase-like oxidoreductase (DUF2520 family)
VKPANTISFIGAGALASGLAKLLHAQGLPVSEIIARATPRSQRKAAALAREVSATATTLAAAKLDCDVLWMAVPDAAIERVAKDLAQAAAARRLSKLPPVVLHASGALSSEVLAALAACGVHTGSAHPMMTFVAGEAPSLQGAWFAVEGAPRAVRAARAIATKLGANCFTIQPETKALYHAFGAMLSPMLATELAAAAQVGLRAGIPRQDVCRIMEPIVLRTVRNALRDGAEKSFSGSFSGPMARGDVRTVESHLRALAGSKESAVYAALMEYAIGAMPVKRAPEMKKLLELKDLRGVNAAEKKTPHAQDGRHAKR